MVSSCSDDIMNYILERVPPPEPGLPKPRFSLYLSSQLQYGVVVVYHRQCAILLGKQTSQRSRHTCSLLFRWDPFPLFRGTSAHCHPAPEAKRHQENRHGWPQQVSWFFKNTTCCFCCLVSFTSTRLPRLLPDALSLMEEAEGALDPLFGVMHLQDPMPSPSAIIQVEKRLDLLYE